MNYEIAELRMAATYKMNRVEEVLDVYEQWREEEDWREARALMEWGKREGYDVENMSLSELREKRSDKYDGREIVLRALLSKELEDEPLPNRSWAGEVVSTAHSALLLMIIATLEENQKMIVSFLREKAGPEKTPEDRKGRYQERFMKYVKGVLKVEYDFGGGGLWDKMTQHFKVRNLIAHNGGILDGSEYADSVGPIIDRLDGVHTTPYEGKIELEEKYVRCALQDANDFLEDLLEIADEVVSA